MKIGSGSTVTSGYWAASSSQRSQWVVTLRPFSSPASASRNAPVQTDASLTTREPALVGQRGAGVLAQPGDQVRVPAARPRPAGNQEQVGRARTPRPGRRSAAARVRSRSAPPVRRGSRSDRVGGRGPAGCHTSGWRRRTPQAARSRPGSAPRRTGRPASSACHQSRGRSPMAAMTNTPPFPPSSCDQVRPGFAGGCAGAGRARSREDAAHHALRSLNSSSQVKWMTSSPCSRRSRSRFSSAIASAPL